jgi:hypothetical protein
MVYQFLLRFGTDSYTDPNLLLPDSLLNFQGSVNTASQHHGETLWVAAKHAVQ